MLLEKLAKITEYGAKKPLSFWFEEYQTFAADIAPELQLLAEKLEDGTQTQKNISYLSALLKISDPDEFDLARTLLAVADIFHDNASDSSEKQIIIQRYIQTGKAFYGRAQTAYFHKNSREQLKKQLNQEEQKNYDLRLFQNEGMFYCLEFYLALYKAMQDSSTENEKRKYIESTSINLGFGSVPGLWEDFKNDEVLVKFIYGILGDVVRNVLVGAYFDAKTEIMKVQLNCDRQGKCTADYQGTSVLEILSAFKRFLKILMQEFQKMGIEKLSSTVFHKPYGDQPKLSDIQL